MQQSNQMSSDDQLFVRSSLGPFGDQTQYTCSSMVVQNHNMSNIELDNDVIIVTLPEPNVYKPNLPASSQNKVFPLGRAPRTSDFLVWSIVNLIVFFYLWIIWLPALTCSLLSKDRYRRRNYTDGKSLATISLILNVICSILGTMGYLLIIVYVSLMASGVLNRPFSQNNPTNSQY